MSATSNASGRRSRDPHRAQRAAPGVVIDLPRRRDRRPRRLVERRALVRRLASSTAPLALLSAPAGYGKTALLAQWARGDRRPFAWIGLDDRANNPVRLVASIAEHLNDIEP